VLRDDDSVLRDQVACGGACGLHQALPAAALLFGLIVVIPRDEACDLRRADGFGEVAVGGALGEQGKDGVFKLGGGCVGFLHTAGLAAVSDDVPVLSAVLAEEERPAAGLAELLFAWGSAFGLAFAFGHWGRDIPAEPETMRGAGSSFSFRCDEAEL
jgi:hypothetical protein